MLGISYCISLPISSRSNIVQVQPLSRHCGPFESAAAGVMLLR